MKCSVAKLRTWTTSSASCTSRAALAIRRKALIADAAAGALADPENSYVALRQHFDQEARELETAEELSADELITRLRNIELKGRLLDTCARVAKDQSVAARQERLRAQIGPAASEDEAGLLFVVDASGELRQLVDASDDEALDMTQPE